MAEALAVLGAAAAVIELVEKFTKATSALRKYSKSIKYAKQEIESVINEASVFADTLWQFSEVMEQDTASDSGASVSSSRRRKARLPVEKLLELSKHSLDGLRRLLKKLKILRGTSHSSTIKRAIAHTRWFFEKDSVQAFRASMSMSRESMGLYMNMIGIKLLKQLLAAGPSVVQSDNVRIATLKRKLEVKENLTTDKLSQFARAQEAFHQCQVKNEATFNEFVQRPEQLLDIANYMKEQAERFVEVIENHRSQKPTPRNYLSHPYTNVPQRTRSPSDSSKAFSQVPKGVAGHGSKEPSLNPASSWARASNTAVIGGYSRREVDESDVDRENRSLINRDSNPTGEPSSSLSHRRTSCSGSSPYTSGSSSPSRSSSTASRPCNCASCAGRVTSRTGWGKEYINDRGSILAEPRRNPAEVPSSTITVNGTRDVRPDAFVQDDPVRPTGSVASKKSHATTPEEPSVPPRPDYGGQDDPAPMTIIATGESKEDTDNGDSESMSDMSYDEPSSSDEPSIFRPVAGVSWKRPKNWPKREQ